MMSNFPMEPVRLIIEEREAGVADMLALAAAYVMPQGGWLLAESPRAVEFRPWDGTVADALKREFSSLIIFGPRAEVRMEKSPGSTTGWMRVVRSDPAGGEFLARRQRALLRDKGRLLCDEYFTEDDDSGFLLKVGGRLCGVEGR